jgi:hypothetical protein
MDHNQSRVKVYDNSTKTENAGRPQNLERFKRRSANTKILYDAGLLIAAGTLLRIHYQIFLSTYRFSRNGAAWLYVRPPKVRTMTIRRSCSLLMPAVFILAAASA